MRDLGVEESHRRYHTWSHIVACFDARDVIADASWPEVDLALLFHDAIYEPLAVDNEARSAELLVEEARRAWLPERAIQRAKALVLATKHDDKQRTDDALQARIVLDADLSILGAEAEVFAAYEEQIRAEYAFVEESIYRVARARILRSFLERPSIYSTKRGQRLWEGAARRNLTASLSAGR